MNEITELIIEVEVYGLVNKQIKVLYKRDTQSIIDQETLRYTSELAFFEQNKEKIRNKIEKKRSEYGLILIPTEIKLKRIYIQKGNRELKAMFQTYLIQDTCHHKVCQISLEAMIKNNLFNGHAILLYQLDKEASKNENYQSLFSNCSKEVLENLELGIITIPTVEDLWETLKKTPHLNYIIRYFLSKKTPEEFKLDFQKIVSFCTKKETQKKEDDDQRKRIPYND